MKISKIGDLVKTPTTEKRPELGLYPSALASISLPVRKPKTRFYERTNGRDTLILESGSWKNPKTNKREAIGLPYGIFPRHILMFLTREYLRNKAEKRNPRLIDIPNTMPEFLKKLGYTKGGETYKAIYQQTFKLLNTRIIIEKVGNNYKLNKEHKIADSFALWWDPKNPDQSSFFNCMALLSKSTEEWFKDALPIRMDTIRIIGQRNLEFDLYLWLNYRHYSVTKPFTICWQNLHQQFGANYKNLRDFKINIKKGFKNVLELYKHNSKLTESGILLQNSKTDIEPVTSSIQKLDYRAEQKQKQKKRDEYQREILKKKYPLFFS